MRQKTSIYEKLLNKAAILERMRIDTFPKQEANKWLPDIAISRDPGSGGRVVAEMVAKKLKWKVLDREFLIDLSKELGIPEAEFANIDEHPRGWWVDLVQSLVNPNYISDTTYIRHLTKLILHAGCKRQTVVVGRGAGFVLPWDKCLHVRITAPLGTRVENTVKFEKMSKTKALVWVQDQQRKRDKFIRQYFGRTAKWVSNYDLVINTKHLSLEATRDIVIDAYYDKFPEMREK